MVKEFLSRREDEIENLIQVVYKHLKQDTDDSRDSSRETVFLLLKPATDDSQQREQCRETVFSLLIRDELERETREFGLVNR